MSEHDLRAKRSMSRPRRVQEARSGVLVVAATIAALGGIVLVGALRERGAEAGPTDTVPVTAAAAADAAVASPAGLIAPAVAVATADPAADGTLPDLEGDTVPVGEDCTIEASSLGLGDTGTDVQCLQQALVKGGMLTAASGTYDQATYAAVRQVQEERTLFVDGVVGRETAMSIGVWPDEAKLVVHTPPPPPGATDSLGYALSSVSSVGADIPPLPENSGSGKRVVYQRAGQRVWAVDDDEQVIRSWLVSGSKFGNEVPGTHTVYSKSLESSAWNFQAKLPLMIRYYKTDIGNIGFHGIPIHVSDGTAYQTEAELGTRLSGGCQRQANPDAAFLWDFAQIGTTVVVL